MKISSLFWGPWVDDCSVCVLSLREETRELWDTSSITSRKEVIDSVLTSWQRWQWEEGSGGYCKYEHALLTLATIITIWHVVIFFLLTYRMYQYSINVYQWTLPPPIPQAPHPCMLTHNTAFFCIFVCWSCTICYSVDCVIVLCSTIAVFECGEGE